MAFNGGAVYGEAILDTKKWDSALSRTLSSSKIAGAAIAAAFVAAMSVSIKKADVFQQSMSNVNTVIDETQISTQSLTKDLYKLDPALGNTTELTKGLYQSFSSGAETAEEAMQTTVDSAKFAKAALTDTYTAVDVLTTAVNAYGKESMSTSQASDIFFSTIKQGKLTGEQLAGTIGQSIPLFASAKIDLNELASGMAAMTKQGVSANESTTQLNAIVNSFLKPSEAMSEALQDLGYYSGSAFLEAEGLSGALKLLEEETHGDAAAMGELLPNIRALRGAMALTGTGGKEFNKILGEMENATGATDKAFEKQEKTFATFKNQLDRLSIITGNIGKHFVDQIAGGATTAFEGIQELLTSSKGMETFAVIAGFAAGGFEILKTVFIELKKNLGESFMKIWVSLKTHFGDLADKNTLLSGGFKILTAAIKLSGIGFAVFSRVIQRGILNIRNLIDVITISGKTIGSFFLMLTGKAKWSEVKENAALATEAFKKMGSDFVGAYGDIIETAISESKKAFSTFKEDAEDLEQQVKVSVSAAQGYIKTNWDEIITGQKDAANELSKSNDEIADSSADAAGRSISSWKKVKDFMSKEMPGAYKAFIEKSREIYDTYGGFSTSIYDQQAAITSQYYSNEQAKLENYYSAELEALEEKYNQGLLTEDEYNTQKEVLENEQREKQNEIAKKQFESEKKNNIRSIWMSAADSVLGFWEWASSKGPFAWGTAGAMSAATLSLAGKQVALVKKQEFVPSYSSGGTASGLSRINEVGGEILNLPDGTMVIPNDISRSIAEGTSAHSGNTININNPVVRETRDIDKIAEAVARVMGRSYARV